MDPAIKHYALQPSVEVKTFHKKQPAPSDLFEKNPEMVEQYPPKAEFLAIYFKLKNDAERTGNSYRVELHEGREHKVTEL